MLRLAARIGRHLMPPPAMEPALAGPGCQQQQRITSVLELGAQRALAASRQHLGAAALQAAEALEAAQEVFGIWILNRQKRIFRGTHGNLNPSLWRWYHRHGYWATRRKMIDFGTKRIHRYHQVEGFGKRNGRYMKKFASWWCDSSYFKPLKNYCRF
ncbi:unnamed protein product [Effrenium voratum]|uniref:Uncharacterized protein n=1 Tax=Effrenium voratum TaxID=2562239 RepID=A0AA36HZ78_9DINO|nr:unnamed protein product [Effrenium voratum]CAJ1427437.1 unnamed protein product [Effrenium voratum]